MKELSKNILFQYFSGTASPLQHKLVMDWLQHAENRETFYQWLEEWEKEHVQFVPSSLTGAAGIMDGTVFSLQSAAEAPVKMVSQWRTVFKLAACVLVVMLAGWLFRDNILYTRYETAFADVKEITLSDGTDIVLNANSVLQVPRWGFGSGDRNVKMSGEAVFKVKHTTTDQRFTVQTNGQLNVEVLGTEFSVYSRNNNNKVALKKGSVKVLFRETDNQPLIMLPGDVVDVNIAGNVKLTHKQSANNFIAWKDHRFIFDSTSLGEAVSYIREFFGNAIIIGDESLREKRITGSFRSDSSAEVLSVLCEMYNMDMQRKEDSIILSSKK